MPNPIPDLPASVLSIQATYAEMIREVQSGLSKFYDGHPITPQMAILIACIGDQTLRPSDLFRLGYFIGTNASYNLRTLESAGLIRRLPVPGDRRQSLIALTHHGIELSASLRRWLSAKIYDAKEAA